MSVPGTLKEVKEHLSEVDVEAMHDLSEGHHYIPIRSHPWRAKD